ncbi:hypothetical protein IAU60_001339 [Kwoniella sp. DSM 27419]
MDISGALSALEALSSSTSTSSSGPLNALIDEHFSQAKERILAGEDAKVVITDLHKAVKASKKDIEKGLKGWYGALGNVGKAAFPPNLGAISKAYEDPPLFSDEAAARALDQVVLDSLGRRGLWEAVSAMEEETFLTYPDVRRRLAEELHHVTSHILSSDLQPAIVWCEQNKACLSSPPHPSALPYHLHKTVFTSIEDRNEAIDYARRNMMGYVPSQPVLKLLTASLYRGNQARYSAMPTSGPGEDVSMTGRSDERADEKAKKGDLEELVRMFREEFCRRHQWPKEDPLEVTVDLGSRGGALNVIEKARRVMGEHLGHVRQWQDLPMEVPLPPTRRYHSVFVCPVSKEQASETNPPKILACGHVLAQESFNRLLKGGRRSAKCPYCPIETSQSVAQRLYF